MYNKPLKDAIACQLIWPNQGKKNRFVDHDASLCYIDIAVVSSVWKILSVPTSCSVSLVFLLQNLARKIEYPCIAYLDQYHNLLQVIFFFFRDLQVALKKIKFQISENIFVSDHLDEIFFVRFYYFILYCIHAFENCQIDLNFTTSIDDMI